MKVVAAPVDAARGRPGRDIRRCTGHRANRANVASNFARDESWSACNLAAISPMARTVRAEAPSRAIMSVARA